jgi:hypothetical protein
MRWSNCEKHTGGASNLIGDGKGRPWCALGRRTKGPVAVVTEAVHAISGAAPPERSRDRLSLKYALVARANARVSLLNH